MQAPRCHLTDTITGHMVRVAFDTGPTHGRRTGIGNAVAWATEALAARDGLDLQPYVTSARARIHAPERRLPLPAALAVRMWAHRSPPIDRWLGYPDLVHGSNYVVPPARCPRIVSVYDCWFLDHPEDADRDVQRAAAALRRAVADGAHVVTSSDATTQRVRELLDTDRVRTVLLGPPVRGEHDGEATPPVGLPHLTEFILALGTMERRKNLPTLVDAFGRLAREQSTVRLVIAGATGNDVGAVDRAIARLSPEVAERVVRTGAVDGATKRWLLGHARALAYPSLDEGFGFPVLEAQQAGTPVVASTAGSIPQVAGAAALLSPASDSEALAANLHWIVTNDEMHAKLVRRGTANVARFSWATTAERYHTMYREVAEDA